MSKFKTPNITKKSKIGQLLNNPVVVSYGFEKYSLDNSSKKFNLNRKEFSDYIKSLSQGSTSYIVSGKVQNKISNEDFSDNKNEKLSKYKRNYSIAFKAKAGLTSEELKAVVGERLREYYSMPRDGNSNNQLVGFSLNSIQIPDNYEFHKRVKLFKLSNLESSLFNQLSEKIELSTNCVIDYLFNEFQKINTNVNKAIIVKRLSEFCEIKYGVSIDAFEKYMNKYHKKIKYSILSPMLDCISHYRPNYKDELHLCFYVNNSHLYPINDIKVQEHISCMLKNKKKYDFHKYFEDMVYKKSTDYKYMEEYEPDCEIPGTTYIMNKDMDINNFCIDLVKSTNTVPDYIDLNHKTGSISEFKHPTKDIIYQSYDDYHNRQSICNKLNVKFNNLFIDFNNQSYASIAQTLLNQLCDIPKSHYTEQTFDYLNKYEPKPIVDILTDCLKEDVYQIDYYKQYSTIFYRDFEIYDIKIPIYDIFNTVEKYNKEDITYGEYFVKQQIYKGVKLFGCFLNYKIVEILLKDKIIKKKDISHCITTTKYFTPSCFKEFVKITSELSEKSFKKLNNILNGTLKNMHSRKSKSFFTSDIHSMLYIYNNCISNNEEIKWQYNEDTGYHFIKIINSKKMLDNTSSFYRSTLSCSILQTIKLIKKCSKVGKVVKVLTDAVYYTSSKRTTKNKSHTDLLVQTPDKTEGIISNLGKYFYDLVEYDLIERRTKDIVFTETELEKNSTYIKGAGGLGKTYGVINDFKDKLLNGDKSNLLFTVFTNSAALNIQEKIIKIVGYIPDNWTVKTITRMIGFVKDAETKRSVEKTLAKYDYIIIDEIITLPIIYLRTLERLDVPKIYMGDHYQMPQIFNTNEPEFCIDKYLSKHCNVIVQKFTEGNARYNAKTYKLLERFKKSGNIEQIVKNVNEIDTSKFYKVNIAYTNKKVDEINTLCCNHYHAKDKTYDFCLLNKNSQTKQKIKKFKIGVGCPIRCESQEKVLFDTYGIVKGWRGLIVNIENDTVDIKGVIEKDDVYENGVITININTMLNYFVPSYAMTCHKWQGQTIDCEFAIWQTQYKYKMNYIYTACSRTGDITNIHINKCKTSQYFKLWSPSRIGIEFKNNTKEHVIYKITTTNEDGKEEINYDTDIDTDGTCEEYLKISCTKQQLIKIINILKHKGKTRIYKPIEINTFKPTLEQRNRKTIINVYNNRIKCTYYDAESGERKIKDMKPSKKRTMNQTFEKMKSFFPNAEINDKNNLILTFC